MSQAMLDWQPVPIPAGRLYESARWVPGAGVFQWVDILQSTLHRWRPGAPEVETRVLDLEFTTMSLPLDAHRSLVTSRSSVHQFDWRDSSLTTLGAWEFEPDVRFNDGGIAPDGAVFLGTMSMERRPSSGALHRFVDGRLETVVPGVGISNGLGWASIDRAYYVDSLVPRVHVIDLSATDPELTTLAELGSDDEPDGLAVTPEGTVLVALWQGSRLAHVTSDGQRLPDVPVPANAPTSVAVGGTDGSLLLVTTAHVEEKDEETDGQVLVAERSALHRAGVA